MVKQRRRKEESLGFVKDPHNPLCLRNSVGRRWVMGWIQELCGGLGERVRVRVCFTLLVLVGKPVKLATFSGNSCCFSAKTFFIL